MKEQVSHLNRVLRGHYADSGVAGNFRALQKVHRAVERYWHKMLAAEAAKGASRGRSSTASRRPFRYCDRGCRFLI